MSAPAPVRLVDERNGRVARLVLDAPPDNAISIDLVEAFASRLSELEARRDLRVVVLEGAGPHFSSGFPLTQRRPPAIEHLLDRHHGVARRLVGLGVPLIAKLRGVAMGAGFELALLCHVILADPTARLGFADGALGSFPPLGSLLLPHRVGQTRAEQLLLEGKPLDGKTAEALGLVTSCPGGWESLDDAATRIIETQLLTGSRTAQRAQLRAMRPWMDALLGAQLDAYERLFVEEIAASPDASEGISAALRARPPRFAP